MFRRFATAVLRCLKAGLQMACILIAMIFIVVTFFILNRTVVIGHENIGILWKLIRQTKRGAFIGASHYTMLDSWVLQFVLAFPRILWNVRYLPWSLPDRANFFSMPGLRHVLRFYRTIPIERPTNSRNEGNRGNLGAVRAMLDIVERKEAVQFFYQGGRTVDAASLGTPKPIVMGTVLGTKSHVLPVLLTGTRAVQPYRKDPGDPPWTAWRIVPVFGKHLEWLFHVRFGKQITIVIGEPWPASEIAVNLASVSEEERVAQFSALFMERMEALRRQAEGLPRMKEAS